MDCNLRKSIFELPNSVRAHMQSSRIQISNIDMRKGSSLSLERPANPHWEKVSPGTGFVA